MPKGIERTQAEALSFIKPLIPLLERGMSEQQACIYSKIPESTLNHYKDKFESVWSEIQRAKMTLIAAANKTIYDNIKDPKIAIEVLKRRDKALWAEKQERDVFTQGKTDFGDLFTEFLDKAMPKRKDLN